ncbi:origin recognition complex subunit 3 N-terminus-domain-containing protein [Schizophyllum amplum]|uniref:Origin recognition complex subunit 3 N-terminus-domain-containing protein n=1 Tax=Schizophyllum amplum TaxID=97359 RepID=A0A550CX67_9AGAR|nr:origin recognition complex subunit 3 N-terminus-domain-containing protein [Auriculariopsis ampla]
MSPVNLDDISQSAVYIPFEGADEDLHESSPSKASKPDPSGKVAWLEEYRKVWTRCLERVQAIENDVHEPILHSVVDEIRQTNASALAGLPYPEIPTICLTNCPSTSSLLSQPAARMGAEDDVAVVELHPEVCSNITTCMKALVSGFVEHPTLLERVSKLKRRTNSLAMYDLGLLAACHRTAPDVRLVAVLCDFEDFDPSIVRQLFEICSLFASQSPLTFVLACASPPAPSYIHATFPHSVLALLRLRSIAFPSAAAVVATIVEKTFFDVGFDPGLMLGPAALDFLAVYMAQHNATVDAAVTILQIAHMRHFATEPLAALPLIAQSSSHANFHGSLTERETARKVFHAEARKVRMGLGIARCVNAFISAQGHRGLPWDADMLTIMSGVLRGRPPPDLKHLIRMVKLLEASELSALLEELRALLASLTDARDAEVEVREYIRALGSTHQDQEDDEVEPYRAIGTEFGEWLAVYLGDLLSVRIEECDLFQIWYTNRAPFPSELLNPNVRSTVLAGLVQPHAFTEAGAENVCHSTKSDDDDDDDTPLWALPDTAILFARYLDSGRMINVYDWFEAFRIVLETQREERAHGLTEGDGGNNEKDKTSRKNSRNKGKKGVADDGIDAEKWGLEVQARFVRALHELDYIGVMKHTGRKADHVVKIVYDVVD